MTKNICYTTTISTTIRTTTTTTTCLTITNIDEIVSLHDKKQCVSITITHVIPLLVLELLLISVVAANQKYYYYYYYLILVLVLSLHKYGLYSAFIVLVRE